jgi:prepilin-type N-terminal cleavage/methylation domain-containing protein/prepilin-type processing-associated H-X9-DG protein
MDNVSHAVWLIVITIRKQGKRRQMETRREGFTLVELLVVISIIALLMAILIPALGRAREAAKSAVCKSHTQQLMVAANLWSADHDDYVVAGMWDVPAKYTDDGTVGYEAKIAIDNGVSLERYTASRDTAKRGLYYCPTIAKFGSNFFYSLPDVSMNISGRDSGVTATTSYGVNSFAVMYTGTTNYLGNAGTTGTGNGGTYDDWGPGDAYMLKHGKARLAEIRNASRKVYFSDFSYIIIYDWMYNPLKVCYRKQGSTDMTPSAYGFVDNFANLPSSGGLQIVQARWHGGVNRATGYGYANIGWFDGSVSNEPKDFDDPKVTVSGGFGSTVKRYAWQQYFYGRN